MSSFSFSLSSFGLLSLWGCYGNSRWKEDFLLELKNNEYHHFFSHLLFFFTLSVFFTLCLCVHNSKLIWFFFVISVVTSLHAWIILVKWVLALQFINYNTKLFLSLHLTLINESLDSLFDTSSRIPLRNVGLGFLIKGRIVINWGLNLQPFCQHHRSLTIRLESLFNAMELK